MTIVGLTGGIGSGKSTVAAMLAERGATVLSGDEVARELVQPGSAQLRAIVTRFGDEMLNPDGSLNRQKLADAVFADDELLAALNDIMDEPIQRELTLRAKAIDGVVVIESPLLIERGRTETVDTVVVVVAPMEVRVARLTGGRGLSADDVRARMSHQLSDEERVKLADVVIVNDGSLESVSDQVATLWERIT